MLSSCCYSIAVVSFLSFPNTICCKTSNFYLTLCDPIDFSLSGSSVHGIVQASVLEWIAVPFSKGSSQPRDRTQVSRIAGRFLTIWTTREAHLWTRIAFIAFWTTNIFFLIAPTTSPQWYLSAIYPPSLKLLHFHGFQGHLITFLKLSLPLKNVPQALLLYLMPWVITVHCSTDSGQVG